MKEILVLSAFTILALVHSSQEKYMGSGAEDSASPTTEMPVKEASWAPDQEASGASESSKVTEPNKEPPVKTNLEATQEVYLNFLDKMIEMPSGDSVESSTAD